MNAITTLNEKNFDQSLAEARLPMLIDFYAPWCGPCKMVAPLLESLAERFAGRIQFCQVNVDDAPQLADRFHITGVPTLMLIHHGKTCDEIVGFPAPRQLIAKLESWAVLAGTPALGAR